MQRGQDRTKQPHPITFALLYDHQPWSARDFGASSMAEFLLEAA
jgi:hypothetical protein